MQTVVYADVLFFINFAMDFVSLYITMKILSRRVSVVRYAAAALVGGIYGVLEVCFDIPGWLSPAAALAVSFMMIFILLGKGSSFKIYAKYTVLLWGIGALLGGAVTLICTLGNPHGISAVNSKGQSSMFVLALGAFLVLFLIRVFFSVPKGKNCLIEIGLFGENYELSALIDSGNMVTEAISGLSVIFIKKKAFSVSGEISPDIDILSEGVSSLESLSPDTRRRVRIVSLKRVGETKLVCGVVSDNIYIKEGRDRKRVKACIVIEDTDGYGGCDCVVPQSLLC